MGPKLTLQARNLKLKLADKLRREGTALFDEGDSKRLQASLPKFEAATDLYHEVGNQQKNEAYCLAAEGYGLSLMGFRQPALVYYMRSLQLSRDIKDRFGIAETLGNIGRIYFQLAENDKALEKYFEALDIYKQLRYRPGQARMLTSIGASYFDKDKDDKVNANDRALSYLKLALPLRRGDKKGEAITLYRIGRVYLEQKKTSEALDHFNRSLALRESVGDRRGIAETLIFIGWTKYGAGEKKEAVDLFNEAFENAKYAGDKPRQAKACFGLQTVWLDLGKPRLSIFYGKQMVNLYQDLRDSLRDLDSEAQNSYLKTIEAAYRKLVEIMISQNRLLEAQNVLDLIKGEEFGDISRSASSDQIPYSRLEGTTIETVESLIALRSEQRNLKNLLKQQGRLFPAIKQQRLDVVTKEIRSANDAFDAALDAIAATNPTASDWRERIKTEANLQSALQSLGHDLNTGVVALYTVIDTAKAESSADAAGTKFGWAILVTATDRKAYPIDVNGLEHDVFEFRRALSSDNYDPRPVAQKIYSAIFRQTSEIQKTTLEADLNQLFGTQADKTIMWSLDGVLRYIPVAALHDGSGYLVEKYRNILFTKESMLWLMNQPKNDGQTLGLGVSAGNQELGLSELPGVEKELSDIIREEGEKTGILCGKRKFNGDFKREDVYDLQDEDNTFHRVHIASHYSFNPAEQNDSYLLVGDGKLTFADMKSEKNLFGSVDLLTLSACDTGLTGNGKESEGFAYLAQSLGAKSVIGSLWKVSDAGTPELMKRFYRFMAGDSKMTKGEAFRKAQLSLLTGSDTDISAFPNSDRSNGFRANPAPSTLPLFVKESTKPYSHPHYWASFVLIGNWR